MTSDKQTVEPCPFCGSDPAISEYEINEDGDTKFAVACDCRDAPECQAFAERYVNAHGNSKAEAIAAWNRRAPASPSLGERREEVARIIDRSAWKNRDVFMTEDGFEDEVAAAIVAPSLAKADAIIALLSRPEGHQDGRGGG